MQKIISLYKEKKNYKKYNINCLKKKLLKKDEFMGNFIEDAIKIVTLDKI